MREYLTSADILGIHAVLLQRYGGASGIRDKGCLDGAVFRPQCGYYKNIIEEACALLESLLINHPFFDGNKRTAFAAFEIFLRINGYSVKADNNVLYSHIIQWLEDSAEKRFLDMVIIFTKYVEKM